MRLTLFLLPLACALVMPRETKADVFEILEPSGDKYMYPFIDDSLASSRDYASTFGAYGNLDDPRFNFDDRDAQFFLDFDTTPFVTPGQGASSYQIARFSVTIVVCENTNLPVTYDPSIDSLDTYTGTTPDTDSGRPIEIYGVNYRGPWSRATFNEDSPFQTAPSSSVMDPRGDWNRKRNAFAMDFDANGQTRDVSNNVEEKFSTNPWAIAHSPGFVDFNDVYQVGSLNSGDLLRDGRVLQFDLDLSNPWIRQYLKEGLHAGRIHLMVSSLHPATRENSAGIPRFYTKDADPNLGQQLAPRLQAEVTITPLGVPPVPKVSVSRLNPSGFRVFFETQTGYRYVVESRDSLASGNWSAKSTTFTGNGGSQFFDDTEANLPATRFYRVAVTAHTP